MSNGSDIILNVKVNLSEIDAPEKIFSSLKSAMNSAINESFKNAKINLNSSINVQSNKNEKNKESSTDKALKDFLTFSSSVLKELSKINNNIKNTSRENFKNERKKENFDKTYFKRIQDEKRQNKFSNSFFSALTQFGVISGILSNRDIKKGLKYGNLLAERYTYRVYDKNGNLTDKREFNPVSFLGDFFSWGKALFNVVAKIYDTLKKNYEQVSTQVELFKTLLETSEKDVDLTNFLTRSEAFGHLNTVYGLATHSDISLDKALEIGKDFYNNEENLLGYGKYKNINGTEFEGAEVKYKTDAENIIALVQAAIQGVINMQTKDGAFTTVRLTKEQQDKRMKELSRNGISSFDINNWIGMEQRESNGKFDINKDRMISPFNITGDRTLLEIKRNEATEKLGDSAIENYDRKTAEAKNKYLRAQNYAFLEDGKKNLQLIAEIYRKELKIRTEFVQNFEEILSGKSITLILDYFNSQKDIIVSKIFSGKNKKVASNFNKIYEKISETDSTGTRYKNEYVMKVVTNEKILKRLSAGYAVMNNDIYSEKFSRKILGFQDRIFEEIEKQNGKKLSLYEKRLILRTAGTYNDVVRSGEKKLLEYANKLLGFGDNILENSKSNDIETNIRQKTNYK